MWIETPRGEDSTEGYGSLIGVDSEGCQRGVCMVVPRRARSRSRGLEGER